MKNTKRISAFFLATGMVATTPSCDVLQQLPTIQTSAPLSQAEVANGLREALSVGIRNAVAQTSAENGFWGNQALRIPWPQDAQRVKSALEGIGMSSLTQQFEEAMNHAAEDASAKATDIFVNAITQMTITDAMGILRGENDAATAYLRRTTETQLTNEFRPVIDRAMGDGQVTQLWSQITTRYNQIPFVQPVQTDLTGYITDYALDGLFKLVAQEEAAIRENPSARVTDLLRRVFGSAAAQGAM